MIYCRQDPTRHAPLYRRLHVRRISSTTITCSILYNNFACFSVACTYEIFVVKHTTAAVWWGIHPFLPLPLRHFACRVDSLCAQKDPLTSSSTHSTLARFLLLALVVEGPSSLWRGGAGGGGRGGGGAFTTYPGLHSNTAEFPMEKTSSSFPPPSGTGDPSWKVSFSNTPLATRWQSGAQMPKQNLSCDDY